jgi:demethylmenaquinone methyltransferase / 2-methoxy-6-polyprenyl-1,4-benzoquinol methylase
VLLALSAQLPAPDQSRTSTETIAGRVNYSVEPPASAIALETRSGRRRTIQYDGHEEQLPATSLGDLNLEDHLADPALKQRFVTPMFDMIAPRYDRFTRVFSFGMDRRWKAELIDWMRSAIRAESRVLDLACGTGDLAFAAAERATRGTVLGLDASSKMIELARRRAMREAPLGNVQFEVGDMSSLALEAASVDAVTAGYGLRNVPEYEVAIREIARVLKPGGVLATLDFYRPESIVWRSLLLAYLRAAGNWVGWLWHREPVVYGYIAPSIDHFVSWQRFSMTLERHGLRVESVRRKLLGGVALHFARRA